MSEWRSDEQPAATVYRMEPIPVTLSDGSTIYVRLGDMSGAVQFLVRERMEENLGKPAGLADWLPGAVVRWHWPADPTDDSVQVPTTDLSAPVVQRHEPDPPVQITVPVPEVNITNEVVVPKTAMKIKRDSKGRVSEIAPKK